MILRPLSDTHTKSHAYNYRSVLRFFQYFQYLVLKKHSDTELSVPYYIGPILFSFPYFSLFKPSYIFHFPLIIIPLKDLCYCVTIKRSLRPQEHRMCHPITDLQNPSVSPANFENQITDFIAFFVNFLLHFDLCRFTVAPPKLSCDNVLKGAKT